MKERGYIEQLWHKISCIVTQSTVLPNDKECFKNGFITSSSSTND